MLVSQIAAVRNSVVFVLRFTTNPTGTVQVAPVGTACHVGHDMFVTANHLFEDPPIGPTEVVRVGFILPGTSTVAAVCNVPANVTFQSAQHDLALLHIAGFSEMVVPGLGTPPPAAAVSGGVEPDGRSVFSYGFITPTFQFTTTGPSVSAVARACASIISGRFVETPDRYELDSSTYPGESGAPVFRQADHVAVAIVQASRLVSVPPPPGLPVQFGRVRGPTIASPIAPIAGELAARGVPILP